ncbi:uncharacterized protein LOC131033308 isoform X2 [Cryptomeria japonica]|uniref:uncharacterized protein LOC131033308 isoform X2 n=1 Tax=Cryptomeria japonica TaxID=3369 RepID=UPI0027DA08F5|nr:uncharacterized protein LOC131033308 isoform X2 [Cryptomeria japonica]
MLVLSKKVGGFHGWAMDQKRDITEAVLSNPSSRQRGRRIGGPTRRSSKGGWTPEEDETLRRAVQCFKGKHWKKIAEFFPDRTDVQCLHRWQKVLNPELVKGPWTKEEDERIIELVNRHGAKKWSAIAKHLPGRIGKQCRERWHNHLNPAINKDAWTREEELALIRAHQIYGNKWAELAKFLPGRTDNAIKNHWNSSIKKKLDTYLASCLGTQFPDLSIANPMIMPSSSKVGEFNNVNRGSEMDEISECSQESISTRCCHTDSLEVPASASMQMECERSESQKATDKTNSDNESHSLVEPLLSQCSGNMHLIQSGDTTHLHAPVSAARLFVSSFETNELAESVITGSSCSLGSPKELSETISVFASRPLGDQVSFASEAVKSASSGEDKILSSNFYTNQPANTSNMVGVPNSLCESDFPLSLPAVCSGYSNVMLRSSVGLGDRACSMEMPPPTLNSTICHDVCSQSASDIDHSYQLLPDHLSNVWNLHIDSHVDSSVPAVVSLAPNDTEGSQMSTKEEISYIQSDDPDLGTLFYEPPRLPSLDNPFVNCDLIQQAYSPLGVRQMIMSSVNCCIPFTPWGSPYCDESPEALLKSAAKTFRSTPSILRKRQRESSNLLEENHNVKRVASEIDFGSILSPCLLDKKGSALLDASTAEFQIWSAEDDTLLPVNRKAIIVSPPYSIKQKTKEAAKSKEKQLVYASEDTNNMKFADIGANGSSEPDSRQIDKDAIIRENANSGFKNDQASGVLVEQNMNGPQMFMASGNTSVKCWNSGSSPLTPKTLFGRRMKTPSKSRDLKGRVKYASGIMCSPYAVSPNVHENRGAKSTSEAYGRQTSSFGASSPIDHVFDKDWLNSVPDLDNINGDVVSLETCIGSPFDWNSPWSLDASWLAEKDGEDALLEGTSMLRNNTDAGEDAVGLMKQLSEHTAPAYAQAEEILCSETRKKTLQTVSSARSFKFSLNEDNSDCKENMVFPDKNSQGENHISSSSYTLPFHAGYSFPEFNVFSTPGRGGIGGEELSQTFTGVAGDFCSPLLRLLKECR